ncbi:unnamed protein product [Gongylonema pulchrum]|uniref:REM-1 domain-containing protein n=1 Tax=Gongylonema pulchrum TaxID=637853 RepID=A0A183F1H3_9BILA|nr:unnamed protein product [Gongylonema pulchrum]
MTEGMRTALFQAEKDARRLRDTEAARLSQLLSAAKKCMESHERSVKVRQCLEKLGQCARAGLPQQFGSIGQAGPPTPAEGSMEARRQVILFLMVISVTE